MIKAEYIKVFNFEGSIRGMRNSMDSWDKSDSGYCIDGEDENVFVIGKNDLDLMRKLYKAGTEQRKYLRQIFVSMDIVAPLYWWKEFDTYKVGITANSCSTMHRITAKEFELDNFSHEHLISDEYEMFKDDDFGYTADTTLSCVIRNLNFWRNKYLKYKDKKYWWQLIQLLPSSYNQRRTITMNYENVVTIIKQRTGHKLTEWEDFVKILTNLPYVMDIIK